MASFCQIVKLETRSPGTPQPSSHPPLLQAIATISTPHTTPSTPASAGCRWDFQEEVRYHRGQQQVQCDPDARLFTAPLLGIARRSEQKRLCAGEASRRPYRPLCLRLTVGPKGWGVVRERQPGCSSVFLPWLNVEPVDGQSWCCPNSVLLCMPQHWGLTLGGLGV